MELLQAAAEARGPAGGGGPPGQNGAAPKEERRFRTMTTPEEKNAFLAERKALAMGLVPAMFDYLQAQAGPLLGAEVEQYFREQGERVQAAVLKEG